jgi:hypothetical protein
MTDITEQEERVLDDEKKDSLKENLPIQGDVEVIEAWQIESTIPSTFYHVRIAITTLRDFSNESTKSWKRLKEKMPNKKYNEINKKYILKYENLLGRMQESDGSQSGMHTSLYAKMSSMEEDGLHSETSFGNFIALVFESNNKEKKYSIRITQCMDMSELKKGKNQLQLIKGGEKYYEKWKGHNERGLMWELELLENVDFNYILAELKNLTTNYIEETNIVEEFYAEREAKKKQEKENARKSNRPNQNNNQTNFALSLSNRVHKKFHTLPKVFFDKFNFADKKNKAEYEYPLPPTP